MDKKYTLKELISIYQQKKKVDPNYTLHDLFIDLLQMELMETLRHFDVHGHVHTSDEDPNEGDRGSHQDQAPEDFLK